MSSLLVYTVFLLGAAQLSLSHSVELNAESGAFKTVLGTAISKFSVHQQFEDHSAPVAVQQLNERNNDFILGVKRPTSALYHRERVFSYADDYTFSTFTAGRITYVEARDLSNGTGGYVRYYRGGIQEHKIELDFIRPAGAADPIDFSVDIWTFSTSQSAPAEEFEMGAINRWSQFDMGVHFDVPATEEGYPVFLSWRVTIPDNMIFQFVEAFDMSGNGTGGWVSLAEGGVNDNVMHLHLRSVAPGVPLRVSFAVYLEDREHRGNHFLFGRYRPGMVGLAFEFFAVPAVADERVNGTVQHSQPNSTIGMIQGWDYVLDGTGQLVAMGGGVGDSNVTLIVESGVGEELNQLVGIFGYLEEGQEVDRSNIR